MKADKFEILSKMVTDGAVISCPSIGVNTEVIGYLFKESPISFIFSFAFPKNEFDFHRVDVKTCSGSERGLMLIIVDPMGKTQDMVIYPVEYTANRADLEAWLKKWRKYEKTEEGKALREWVVGHVKYMYGIAAPSM